MTSERILLGNKPGIDPSVVFEGPKERSSKIDVHPQGANEPTASIVWSLMLELGVAPHEFIFWNSLPTHPHKPGQMLTNRAPKPHELAAAAALLPMMIELVGNARLVAVGRVAQKTLAGLGHTAEWVRHPAMGGANEFRQQVRALL